MQMALAAIKQVSRAPKQREGAGFIVRRAIGGRLPRQDPFLMLDHLGPATYGPGEAVGAPDHPHRGFETVTYVLQGGMQHLDSKGNTGNLQAGWCQWMTAGSGVIHSEMPNDDLMKNGGTLEGFQLWVNLPAKDKMTPPKYQDTPPEHIPCVRDEKSNASVKVIAGSWKKEGDEKATQATIHTRSPIFFLDVAIDPNGRFRHTFPATYGTFLYVYRGNGIVNKTHKAEESETVLFDRLNGPTDTTTPTVSVEAETDSVSEMRFLLIGGVPLNEPIAQYGPFVMNTQAEIEQAIFDFQTGKFGNIEGEEQRMRISRAAVAKQKQTGTWDK